MARAHGADRGNGEQKVVVAFTVKELLENLDAKLKEVLKQLGTKAETADLKQLQESVLHLEKEKAAVTILESIQKRVDDLEGRREVQDAIERINKNDKRWKWMIFSFAITSAIAIGAMIAEFLRH